MSDGARSADSCTSVPPVTCNETCHCNHSAYMAVGRSLLQLRRDFLLLRSWMGDLDALQSGEAVGMLHVSCTELQSLLAGKRGKGGTVC